MFFCQKSFPNFYLSFKKGLLFISFVLLLLKITKDKNFEILFQENANPRRSGKNEGSNFAAQLQRS